MYGARASTGNLPRKPGDPLCKSRKKQQKKRSSRLVHWVPVGQHPAMQKSSIP
ncbi:hypothetical protein SAMN05216428_103111 [Nitrosospira sp. Nsp11]|nr:hypothetical protein SAMN05216315_109112 [Nitrosospira sp. Nsp18]SHL53284.1 hypothetical protein SAMN05216428_103111 [Nitrosospira sp. Nsp11]